MHRLREGSIVPYRTQTHVSTWEINTVQSSLLNTFQQPLLFVSLLASTINSKFFHLHTVLTLLRIPKLSFYFTSSDTGVLCISQFQYCFFFPLEFCSVSIHFSSFTPPQAEQPHKHAPATNGRTNNMHVFCIPIVLFFVPHTFLCLFYIISVLMKIHHPKY